MSHKYFLFTKEVDGKKFYFVDFGSESHGRSSFRLWVHYSLVQKDENGQPYLELPCQGSLSQGKSDKTVILRPGEGWIFQVGTKCGYRGYSNFEILSPNVSEDKVFEFQEYRSPAGSLGVSYYALVESPEGFLKVKETRTGRLYGAEPVLIKFYHADGKVEAFENADECELEDLAEVSE